MTTYNVTVANGGTQSGAVNLLNDQSPFYGLVGIVTPSALTSTTITIQPSLDGSTFLTHADYTGTSYTIPIGTNRWIALDPAMFAGFPWVRIVTGSAEGADRTFKLVVRAV